MRRFCPTAHTDQRLGWLAGSATRRADSNRVPCAAFPPTGERFPCAHGLPATGPGEGCALATLAQCARHRPQDRPLVAWRLGQDRTRTTLTRARGVGIDCA